MSEEEYKRVVFEFYGLFGEVRDYRNLELLTHFDGFKHEYIVEVRKKKSGQTIVRAKDEEDPGNAWRRAKEELQGWLRRDEVAPVQRNRREQLEECLRSLENSTQ